MTQDELAELRQVAREDGELLPILPKRALRELLAVYDAALAYSQSANAMGHRSSNLLYQLDIAIEKVWR